MEKKIVLFFCIVFAQKQECFVILSDSQTS